MSFKGRRPTSEQLHDDEDGDSHRAKLEKLEKIFNLMSSERFVRDFHCAYHRKGAIHHGRMYLYSEHVCFANLTKKTNFVLAFTDILAIRDAAFNNIVLRVKDSSEKGYTKYLFSAWTQKRSALTVLNLLFRRANGDTSLTLQEIIDMPLKGGVPLNNRSANDIGQVEGGGGRTTDLASFRPRRDTDGPEDGVNGAPQLPNLMGDEPLFHESASPVQVGGSASSPLSLDGGGGAGSVDASGGAFLAGGALGGGLGGGPGGVEGAIGANIRGSGGADDSASGGGKASARLKDSMNTSRYLPEFSDSSVLSQARNRGRASRSRTLLGLPAMLESGSSDSTRGRALAKLPAYNESVNMVALGATDSSLSTSVVSDGALPASSSQSQRRGSTPPPLRPQPAPVSLDLDDILKDVSHLETRESAASTSGLPDLFGGLVSVPFVVLVLVSLLCVTVAFFYLESTWAHEENRLLHEELFALRKELQALEATNLGMLMPHLSEPAAPCECDALRSQLQEVYSKFVENQ